MAKVSPWLAVGSQECVPWVGRGQARPAGSSGEPPAVVVEEPPNHLLLNTYYMPGPARGPHEALRDGCLLTPPCR